MITLSPELQAVQNSGERRPLVKMRSSTYLPEIPFDGSIFNPNFTENECAAEMILLSDNSLAVIYDEPKYDRIYFMRSDAAKQQFTQPVVIYNAVTAAQTPCMVELPGGNVGVVLVDAANGIIRRMVISPAGAVVTAAATIQDWSNDYIVSGGTVARLADGTYRIAIGIKNKITGVWSVGVYSSPNFLTWGAISYPSLPGLAADMEKFNPCLYQASSGMLVLALEYATFRNENGQITTNIYSFLSSDAGATWASGQQVTNYTGLNYDARYPNIAEKSDGDILLSYTEEVMVRFIDKNSVGYLAASGGDIVITDLSPTSMHYDSATGLLYVLNSYNSTGTKALLGILVIDVASWTIRKAVTNLTVPAYNNIFTASHIWWDSWRSEGQYTCFGVMGGFHFGFYDSVADTVTQFSLKENITYGLDQNVNGVYTSNCLYVPVNECSVRGGQISADERRFYLLFTYSSAYCAYAGVWSIDLAASPDPITGRRAIHSLWESGYSETRAIVSQSATSFLVVPEEDLLFVAAHDDLAATSQSYHGGLWVIQLSTGQQMLAMNYIRNSSFHKCGMKYLCYANGHLYGSFDYTENYGQGDRRGLMDVNIASQSVTYHRPPYTSANNYALKGKTATPDGKILIATQSSYGVVTFDPATYEWAYYNEETLPGISNGGLLGFGSIAHDPENGIIFGGSWWSHGYQAKGQIAAFNETGAFQQSKFHTGDRITGDAYSFSALASDLTRYAYDFDASVVYDETDSLWAVWTKRKIAKQSIMWDSETQSPDLTSWLLAGTPIDISWDITAPNRLSFALADGHLFDPQNSLSTLSNAVEKGRVIEVSFGESINDVPYWQSQGRFLVTENRVSYVMGSAPTISVAAEDLRSVWEHMNIVATEDYSSAMPHDILIDLLQDHCGLTPAGYDVVDFANAHPCYVQFINQTFADIVRTLCDHFGYFPFVDTLDRVTFKRIDLSRPGADNMYPPSAVIGFSPEDTYSNFVNQVVVNSESHETIEVLYAAEAIKDINGTLGWWGGENRVRVWYSSDKSRTCLNPRLEIHQSVKEYSPFMGLFSNYGSEGIVGEDDLHQWCEVKTEMPSMIAFVLGEIAALAVAASMAMSCDYSRNCGMYIIITQSVCGVLFSTLASVAMYHYTVWANPVGHEKQQIAAKANDVEKQTEMNGRIVSEAIDDPLCHEVGHCAMVAAYELGIARAQRNTVRIEKVSHLQDEIGDIVGVQHPYTGQALRGFVTNLKRSYLKPDAPSGGDGHFIDFVEMWRL